MAKSYTANLKLILEDTLTTTSRYNLQRIDSLGDVFTITNNRNVEVRSEADIVLRPNASESGGSGSGGQMDIGTSTQFLDSLYAYVDTFAVFGDMEISSELKLKSGNYTVGLQAPTLTSSLTFTLPDTDGSSGQVLSTDGSGNLDWQSPGGKDSGSFTWTQGDGTTKTINHGFNSANLSVLIYDNATGTQVGIETINELDTNTVELTALEAPPSTGYEVHISEI